MKKYLFQITILLFVVVAFSNCSKYEEGPAISLLSKNARASGDWKVVLLNNQDLNDVVVWSFNDDESFVRSYNGTANVNPAKWAFNSSKEIIEIYYINDDFTEYYTIMQLKNSTLILEIDFSGNITRYEFEAVK